MDEILREATRAGMLNEMMADQLRESIAATVAAAVAAERERCAALAEHGDHHVDPAMRAVCGFCAMDALAADRIRSGAKPTQE